MNILKSVKSKFIQKYGFLNTTVTMHQYFGLIILACAPIGLLYAPLDSFGQIAVFCYAAGLMCIRDVAHLARYNPVLTGFVLRSVIISSIILIEGASLLALCVILLEYMQYNSSILSRKESKLLMLGTGAAFLLSTIFGNYNFNGAYMSAVLAIAMAITLVLTFKKSKKYITNSMTIRAAANQNVKTRLNMNIENSIVFACSSQGEIMAVSGQMSPQSFTADYNFASVRNISALFELFSVECQSVLKLGMVSAGEHRVLACALTTHSIHSKRNSIFNCPVMVEIIPVEEVSAGFNVDERADVLIRLQPIGIHTSAAAQPAAHVIISEKSLEHKSSRSVLSHATIGNVQISHNNRRSSIAM